MIKKIIIGIIAGLISGFFSTGGGMILVPAFVYILKMSQKEARATSITCILPMVITTSFFYAKNDYIDWKIGVICGAGGILGSFFGSKFFNKIPDSVLRIIFVLFILYVAFNMIGVF